MVYLDYNASTPLDQRVLPPVAAALSENFGNPASTQHRSGATASLSLDEAREAVAGLLQTTPQSVVWTSGATEALTLALVGGLVGQAPERTNVVVSATEHKAVLAAAELACRLTGGRLLTIACLPDGTVDLGVADDLISSHTAIVAVMAVNNETGVINPVGAVAEMARHAGALLLCDITQAVGKTSIDTFVGGADLLAFSSHKMYGPKGAGALVADRYVQQRLVSFLPGGGQERGLRGGTPNVPAIVGFGAAAAIASVDRQAEEMRVRNLADDLLKRLQHDVDDVHLNSLSAPRVANTLNVRFAGADAETVMQLMPDVEVSAGSACQAATPTPSHVLMAMGLSARQASESLRISLGRPTTEEDVDYAAGRIAEAVRRAREMN